MSKIRLNHPPNPMPRLVGGKAVLTGLGFNDILVAVFLVVGLDLGTMYS